MHLTLQDAPLALGHRSSLNAGENAGSLWEGDEGHQACVPTPTPARCPHLRWVPTSLPMCPQALRVNGLEQLCNNLASERLQLFSSQMLLAQEEVRGPGVDRAGGHSEQRPSLLKGGHCTESSTPKPACYGLAQS